jgi:hypothetical protein
MFGSNSNPVPSILFDGFNREDAPCEALDEFKTSVIAAYERALERGICSNVVISVMLDLASVELGRHLTFSV